MNPQKLLNRNPTTDMTTTNEVTTSKPATITTNATNTNTNTNTNTTENSTSSVPNTNRLATTKVTTTTVATNNFCKFPFKLRDRVYWDCVWDDEGRGKVCNVEQEGSEIPYFKNTSTFQLCGECLDPCRSKSYFSYTGFPVNNSEAGSKKYSKVCSEDCQTLWQSSEHTFEYFLDP